MAEKKFIDSNGLLYYHQGLKTKYVANVAYDSAAGKITKTVNGVASDILSLSTLKTDMALNNVGNFKAVSTIASQGLTNAEKTNARENIGAGTSSFGGSFSDLTNKPTTLAGYGITDAKIENGTITLGSSTISLSGVYKYKGSVATKAALDEMTQASLTTGDVYNVESNGKNYAYVEWDNTESKPVWDDLGGTFSIEAITNAEIDAILAS